MNWIPIVVLIAGVVATAALSRIIIKWGAHRFKWVFLEALATSISNLIYVVGLKLLLDIVPIHPKVFVWIDHISYVLAVVIILGIARRAVFLALEWNAIRSAASGALSQGFIPLLKNVITLFVFLSGGIMVLKHFNYDVMSLVTALGVSSLAVGLAAKETLSNMISGFTVIIDRNLKPGDRINLNGLIGEVDEIGLRSTRIKTGDGNLLIVPNSELVNTKILNLSTPTPRTSCSTTFRIPCSVPFESVRSHCVRILSEIEFIHHPGGNWVHLSSLSEGHQLITVGFWVARLEDQGAATSEFNQRLLKQLLQDHISLVAPPARS